MRDFANLAVGNGSSRLLLAKALYGLRSAHDCGCRDAGGDRAVGRVEGVDVS